MLFPAMSRKIRTHGLRTCINIPNGLTQVSFECSFSTPCWDFSSPVTTVRQLFSLFLSPSLLLSPFLFCHLFYFFSLLFFFVFFGFTFGASCFVHVVLLILLFFHLFIFFVFWGCTFGASHFAHLAPAPRLLVLAHQDARGIIRLFCNMFGISCTVLGTLVLQPMHRAWCCYGQGAEIWNEHIDHKHYTCEQFFFVAPFMFV